MININPKSEKPIYEQIVNQMKENILKGYLKEGDSIPSIRKLAMLISINPNTVSRAYQELERQKIIETVQGKGTFIKEGLNMKMDKEKLSEFRDKLKTIIIEMRYLDLTKEEIIHEFNIIFEELKGE